jgi:Na+/H+ antiporter NhaC
MKTKNNWFSLTPLILFVAVYLGLSLYLDDFYKVPVTVAFMVSCIYGVIISRGIKLDERMEIFSSGAGNSNLLIMIWIFVLAGAFAKSAQGMGAVDATVQLALYVLPSSFIIPGLFLAACFISISVGTSVGTIVALTPVAVGIATQIGTSVPMITAVVVGGAFFGDNLSFISDTTVVASKTQGCEMKDKFKANARIVFPAAAIMMVICFWMGSGVSSTDVANNIEYVKVLPYLAVLVAALAGVNVMIVLVGGIVLTAIVGFATNSYDIPTLMSSMGDGIMGMGELIIVTLLAGGMLGLIRHNGGLDYLTQKLTSRVKTKRGAELCIGLLVTLTDICTANNTIAILTTGPVAKNIADKYGISPRRSASLLDTFSCFAQGLIPYGAQLLMASALASVTPIDIIKYLYYPLILGIVALVFIIVSRDN